MLVLRAPRPSTPGAPAITGPREQVWSALYEQHVEYVYRLVRRAGVVTADAEDVTQRVYLRVHELLGQTPEIVHPLAWLRAVTMRVVAEHHRFWRLRRVKQWVVESTTNAGRAATPTPEQRAAASQEQLRVADVMTRMSAKLRDVLVLADLEDLSPSEVATILGIPTNTVRSRRLLAREQFAQIWAKHYGGWP
jgi:RNA polymerase sigma-70 factor, ECF subfamily